MADTREEIVTGFANTGVADDMHGGSLGPDGRLYGCQNGLKRIVAFDWYGNVLATYAEGKLSQPEGLLLLDPNTLLVADGPRIMRLDIRRDHLTTVFFEKLVSPRLAETVASVGP